MASPLLPLHLLSAPIPVIIDNAHTAPINVANIVNNNHNNAFPCSKPIPSTSKMTVHSAQSTYSAAADSTAPHLMSRIAYRHHHVTIEKQAATMHEMLTGGMSNTQMPTTTPENTIHTPDSSQCPSSAQEMVLHAHVPCTQQTSTASPPIINDDLGASLHLPVPPCSLFTPLLCTTSPPQGLTHLHTLPHH